MNAAGIVAILLETDPDVPSNPKGEMDRLLPTKRVVLRGNSMLHVPGIIRSVQARWRSRGKRDKKYAYDVIHSWEGLPEEMYLAILNGQCRVEKQGDDAVVTVELWKK